MAAYVKANNTTNLNIASSWTVNSGFPSSTDDTATWNSTVTGANTVSLGGAITAGTITIEDPGGLVTLNAATTTTLTVGSGGFNLSSATQNLDINGPIQIALAANQPWSVASGRRLATGTEISGAYVITKNGTGLLQLNNSGTFSGITLNAGSVWVVVSGAGLTTPIGARTNTTAVTIANGGKLEFQANDVIATAVNINATNLPQITLNGNADNGTYLFATRYNGVGNVTLNSAWLVQASTDGGSFRGWQFIGTITSTGTSRISSNNSTPNHLNGIAPTTFNVTSGTLTIESSAPLIDASPAQAGAGALTKSGAGTLTVAAANTFTGAVSVTAGTLNANSATALGAASSTAGISVSSGATLSLGGASNITYTAPRTLTLAGTGVSPGTPGALVIANAVTNTFSGIVLTAGTLIRASESGTLTAPVTTNNHNLTFTVAAGKTLTLPSTSVISASTTTVSYNTVSGDTGTAVVSAQNLYTNPTVIGQGTVRVGASSVGSPGSVTSGPLGRGQLTWNGGALDASTTATLGNNVVLGGDVSFGGTAALTLAGTVSLGASRIITTNGSGGALTLSGVVSGTGFSLTKAGTNTLILSSANTYTGGTTIRAGTVVASNADALGTSGTITLNDASTGTSAAELKINASAGTVTLARPIVVANQGTGTTTLGSATTSGTSIARFSGAVTLAKSVTLDGGSAGDRLEFLGGISGTGNVTVAGTNRVIFMTVANTYAGTTTINSGAILQLSDGTATATSLLPSTQSVTVNGILRLAKGANSQTIDALNGSGTVSQIVLGAATLVVGNNNGSGTFSGALTDSFGGPLGLTKLGTGTQTLTGTSTYTGPTTISGGTLSFANGSLGATSSITINGGTLQWAAGNTQDISVPVFLQNGGSAIFDTNGNNASLSGEIAGSTSSSFTKTGVGTLSLQGGSSFNWTGNTTVSVGKLVVAGSAYFLGSGSISIAAGTEFSFATSQNITLSGPISGAGALTKSSTGTLTLSSSTASSYTGPVTISEGRLDANLLSPLGSSASTQPITVSSGATLSLGAVGNTANSRVLYLAGTGVTATTGALILNTTGTVSLSRFDLTGATLIRATESGVVNNGITSNNNDLTISVASGTTLRMTSVAVIGASTTSVSYHTVSGDTGTVLVQAKHLYTGTTTINQGTISVNTGSLGSPGSITSGPFGRGQINWNGGAFATEVGQTPTVGNDIVVGGDVSFKGPEVLTLSGPVLLSASRTITTDGTGNQLEISGTISGAGSKLTKAGSRTIRLTAANTYDGGTDIVAGVVETGNTQALGTAGTVTLRAGARLRTRIAGGVNGKLTVAALDNSEGGVIQIGSF